MGGGLTIPRTPTCTPAPLGICPAYALPPHGVSDFIEPANLNKTGTGIVGTDDSCGKYR